MNANAELFEVGTVTRVFEYGAYLDLSKTQRIGYLHISALGDVFTTPPLSDKLQVGDAIPVVVRSFDPKHNCWEVSHKEYLNQQSLELLGVKKGDVRSAVIRDASEVRTTVQIEGSVAYLYPPPHPWSKYRVLLESKRLIEGNSVQVEVGNWDAKSGGLLVHLPNVLVHGNLGEAHQGRVMLHRSNYVKKKCKLQSIIYASFGDDLIARVELTDILDVESAFPVGSVVPIILGNCDPYTGLFGAQIVWERTTFRLPNVVTLGEVREAPIIWVSPYGARCLIDNRVIGFMHKSSVMGSVPEHLNLHLHPGDLAEIRVTEGRDQTHGTYKVEFLRLLDRFADPEDTGEPEFIDLASVRRSGTKGGFSREANFRWNVLDAYDHCCCVCGLRFSIGEASAMEAAHVVPRSHRGCNVIRNALCLCPIHHWAFDRGLLTIDDERQIRIAASVRALGDKSVWLTALHGQEAALAVDAPVSRAALAWHRRNIFLDG